MPPRLSMHDVAVAYGEVRVLDGVSLRVDRGEVRALLGENGAGKSTLLKALAGAVPLARGIVELDGEAFRPRRPADALRAGIATIHQELSLPGHLTVADAIALGAHATRFLFVDRRARDAAAREALALVGRSDLPLGARVRELPASQQQLVEIARALARDARVVVMDEPTSSLGGDDQQRLFAVVDRLRERGIAVLWVSHSLPEVRRTASTATVLRDGVVALETSLAVVDDATLVRAMAGREVAVRAPRTRIATGPVALVGKGITGAGGPVGATFELRRGEVLGIAGLAGAGRTELLEVLFALRQQVGGELAFVDPAIRGRGVAARWRSGIGLVAEDRKANGLATAQSIAENAGLPLAARIALAGSLSPTRLESSVRGAVESVGVKCRSLRQRVRELSGGNQQKVAFARLLAADCSVLLLDEPTRGIDVRTRAEIHDLLRERAASGAAVLVVSSQLPELLEVCDRIAVMRKGVLSPPHPVAEWTQESLLSQALPDHAGGAS